MMRTLLLAAVLGAMLVVANGIVVADEIDFSSSLSGTVLGNGNYSSGLDLGTYNTNPTINQQYADASWQNQGSTYVDPSTLFNQNFDPSGGMQYLPEGYENWYNGQQDVWSAQPTKSYDPNKYYTYTVPAQSRNQTGYDQSYLSSYNQANNTAYTQVPQLAYNQANTQTYANQVSFDDFQNVNQSLPPIEAYWGLTAQALQQLEQQVQMWRQSQQQNLQMRQQQVQLQTQQSQQALQQAQQTGQQQLALYQQQIAQQWQAQDQQLALQKQRLQQDWAQEDQYLAQRLAQYPPAQREAYLLQVKEQRAQHMDQLEQQQQQVLDQRAAQQSQMTVQKAQQDAQYEQESFKQRAQQVQLNGQMQLAALALQGPPVGGTLQRPNWQIDGRLVTMAERQWRERWQQYWIQQRRVEEQRAIVQQQMKVELAKIQLDATLAQQRRQLAINRIQYQEKIKLETERIARETARKKLSLQREIEKAQARRKVEDLQWQTLMTQLNQSNQAVNLTQYYEYRRQLVAYRQEQDMYFRNMGTYLDRQAQDATMKMQQAQQQSQLQFQQQEQQLAQYAQQQSQALTQWQQQCDMQLNQWKQQRQVEEQQVEMQHQQWVQYQAQIQAQYQQYMGQ